MIIRSERAADVEAITQVTTAAYKDSSHNQHTEYQTIIDLRAAGDLTISLVAEVGGETVGHVAFSPVSISDGTENWYGLGPLSVRPDHQGETLGTALVSRGLSLLKAMHGKGCVAIGLPTFFSRFGFTNHPSLEHKGTPQEIFVAMSFNEQMPHGTVKFHKAFYQLSTAEKDAIVDIIIDYDIAGIRVNPANFSPESLLAKEILTELPSGKFVLRPSALAEYDPYLAKVSQFRLTEMSRVHKNPIMAAVRHGIAA